MIKLMKKKKNDNNKIDLTKFWGIHGNNIKINGKIAAFNGGSDDYATVYSSVLMPKGIHKIKLKVLENSNCFIGIGITSTTNYKNDWCLGKNKDTYNYGYHSPGEKWSHESSYGVSGVSSYGR
eukprot:490165_1